MPWPWSQSPSVQRSKNLDTYILSNLKTGKLDGIDKDVHVRTTTGNAHHPPFHISVSYKPYRLTIFSIDKIAWSHGSITFVKHYVELSFYSDDVEMSNGNEIGRYRSTLSCNKNYPICILLFLHLSTTLISKNKHWSIRINWHVNCISCIVVSVLALSTVDLVSNPSWGKPKTIKLVFVCSPLSTRH